jgi:hypothetical protein
VLTRGEKSHLIFIFSSVDCLRRFVSGPLVFSRHHVVPNV